MIDWSTQSLDLGFVLVCSPQGAVLSPILFNIMMQDIPQMEHINTHIFADDVTVTTSGVNMKEAKQQLQTYLKKFEQDSMTYFKIRPPII